MTALSVIQTAAAWLSVPIPSAAFSATDQQTIQLRNLLNEEGTELMLWPDHAWTKLIKEKTFSTTNAAVQSGALASDFGRFIDGSMWDRTTDRPVWGPMDGQQWQQQQAGPTFTTMYYGFRLRGTDFLMTPTPTAGDTIAYEYVSNQYVIANGDTTPSKSNFTADTDTCVFDETLLARGLRWRFLKAKGLPCQQEYSAWLDMVQRFASRDGGAPKLSMARNYPLTRLSPFVPDTGYGR